MNRQAEPTTAEPRGAGASGPAIAATPRLAELLARLRRRMAAGVWLHGLGTLFLAVAGWLVFAYFADRVLRVPHAVRVGHGLVLLGAAGYFLWRDLLRPLSRLPSRRGLAVLFERRHPELEERFVSAVEFQETGTPPGGSPTLVRRVLEQADELAGGLAPTAAAEVLDPAPPRLRLVAGGGLLGLVLAGALWQPREARIFLDRLLGGTTPWPQRTELVVDVPLEGPGVRVEREPGRLSVRVARGSDVPILVRAEGVVPDEVRLRFDVGRDMVLSPSGGGAFRTLLRSCQEDLSFRAVGGDDLDGDPLVVIEVLRPPDVGGIAFAVRPPAYSGAGEELLFQREVDVLAGSRVRVHVLPEPAGAAGSVRVLPDERVLPLEPAPFPAAPADDGALPGAAREGLAFDWHAESSVGFRVELSDDSGLENPEPGLYRIRVVEDRAPEVAVLQPARSEFEIVRGGAFPLRARVEDDFGIASLGWLVAPSAGEDSEPVLRGSFAPGVDPADPAGAAPREAIGHVRIEVDALGSPARPLEVDQRFEVVVEATDNRQPEAGVGRSPRLRARVVTPEELLRRMQDRLAQARLAALRMADLQREKRQRVRELVESGDGDGSGLRAEASALAAALSGQRRVLVEARSLARELASVAEDVLYSRTDEKAGELLERYDASQAELEDALFRPEPWLALAQARRDDPSIEGGFAGNLVSLVELALEVSEEHAQAAAGHLADAERATGAAAVRDALVASAQAQDLALQRMDDLLVRLSEWDNFQNILSLTRDILNRQKALRERTQQFASQK